MIRWQLSEEKGELILLELVQSLLYDKEDILQSHLRCISVCDYLLHLMLKVVTESDIDSQKSNFCFGATIDKADMIVTSPFVVRTNFCTLKLDGSFCIATRCVFTDEEKSKDQNFLQSFVDRMVELILANASSINKFWKCVEDQQYLRDSLKELGGVAFVGNGSILPRNSHGISSQPSSESIPFESPKSLEITVSLPYRGDISGMLIPYGVTG